MPGPLFSELLFEGAALPAGVTLSAHVPAGFRWVVREVDSHSKLPFWEARDGFSVVDTLGASITGVGTADGLGDTYYHWSGRQIVDAGDQLRIFTFDDGWSIRISGYVLTV